MIDDDRSGSGRETLPAGSGIVLDHRTRRIDGGRVLVGGSPLRLLRLSEAGARLLDRWSAGEGLPTGGPGATLARRLLDAGMVHPRPGPETGPFDPVTDVAIVIPFRGPAEELRETLVDLADLVGLPDEAPGPGPGQASAPSRDRRRSSGSPSDPRDTADAPPGEHGERPGPAASSRPRTGPGAQDGRRGGHIGSDDGRGVGGASEVVVVDDGSPDREGVAAVAAEAGARLVRHGLNRGPAAARNTGWRATDRPVVLFFDALVRPDPAPRLSLVGSGPVPSVVSQRGADDDHDIAHLVDARPGDAHPGDVRRGRSDDADPDDGLAVTASAPTGWLEPLLVHLADPEVAAVAPRVVTRPDAHLPEPLSGYEQDHSPLDLGPDEAIVRPGSTVPYVPTAALVVRRDALAEIGGFDETLRHGEDVDLVWRLGAAGRTVRYEPSVVASHPARSSVGAWLAQRVGYGSSAAPLAVRHGAAVAPLRLSGWSAAAWGLASVGHPFAGIAVAAGSTAALARKLSGLDDPVGEAVRLAGRGHLHAGEQIGRAVRRAWLPLAALAAVADRRARVPVVAAILGPAVLDAVRSPSSGRIRDAALAVVDDAAYCAGVWRGSLRHRTVRALLPASSGPVNPPS